MQTTVRMQEITPQIAKKWLEEKVYERQRAIRPAHVHFLAGEMKAGRFTSNTIGICVLPGGTEYIINGYHTLSAVLEANQMIKVPVQFFQVRTHQDVAKHFSHFDRQLRRTRVDSIRAHGLVDQFELPPTILNKFGAACTIIMQDFATGGGLSYVPDDEVILFMIEWLEYAKAYVDTIKETPMAPLMQQRHIFPIGLVTCRYSKKAPEFWNKVATDDGLSIGDPRKALHSWLNDTAIAGHTASKRHVTQPEALRAVANAWNAYCDGRELKFIRVTNTTLPVMLRETPYDPKWKPGKKGE